VLVCNHVTVAPQLGSSSRVGGSPMGRDVRFDVRFEICSED